MASDREGGGDYIVVIVWVTEELYWKNNCKGYLGSDSWLAAGVGVSSACASCHGHLYQRGVCGGGTGASSGVCCWVLGFMFRCDS
jgi:hypothetical protein